MVMSQAVPSVPPRDVHRQSEHNCRDKRNPARLQTVRTCCRLGPCLPRKVPNEDCWRTLSASKVGLGHDAPPRSAETARSMKAAVYASRPKLLQYQGRPLRCFVSTSRYLALMPLNFWGVLPSWHTKSIRCAYPSHYPQLVWSPWVTRCRRFPLPLMEFPGRGCKPAVLFSAFEGGKATNSDPPPAVLYHRLLPSDTSATRAPSLMSRWFPFHWHRARGGM